MRSPYIKKDGHLKEVTQESLEQIARELLEGGDVVRQESAAVALRAITVSVMSSLIRNKELSQRRRM